MVKSRPQRAWRNHIDKKGFGQHIKMGSVNGWRAVKGGLRIGVMRIPSMGKNVCLNFLQSLLENVDRRRCNYGSRVLIPIFHSPHKEADPLHLRFHLPHAVVKKLLFEKAHVIILTPGPTVTIWCLRSSQSLSVTSSVQSEAMDVSSSTLQGSHYM